jgi:outer membrane protein OmpA-like peptidoglycan-associated protein
METKNSLSRRSLLGILSVASAVVFMPTLADAQSSMPSAGAIQRQLQAAPRARINGKLTLQEFKRSQRTRTMAPSIDIQAINFRTGSSQIERAEFWKVDRIAQAIGNILQDNPDELFLIEGHTDAVGSRSSNQLLSQRRAQSMVQTLGQYYGIPGYALEAAGYGEDFLLVPTPNENWRNRRVTLRRITDFIR